MGSTTSPAGGEPERNMSTILIVDDDRGMRTVLRRQLATCGAVLREAHDASSALAIAKAEAVTLLIVDVVLPGMHGPGLVVELRREHPDVAVIFISGHDAPTVARYGVSATDAFVQKPFPAALLRERVEHALAAGASRTARLSTGNTGRIPKFSGVRAVCLSCRAFDAGDGADETSSLSHGYCEACAKKLVGTGTH